MQPAVQDGVAALAGVIRPRGVGAFLAAAEPELGADFGRFLENQRQIDAHADFNVTFPARKTALRQPPPSPKYGRDRVPEGMVAIPPVTFNMSVEFRIRECGFYGDETDIDISASLQQIDFL